MTLIWHVSRYINGGAQNLTWEKHKEDQKDPKETKTFKDVKHVGSLSLRVIARPMVSPGRVRVNPVPPLLQDLADHIARNPGPRLRRCLGHRPLER